MQIELEFAGRVEGNETRRNQDIGDKSAFELGIGLHVGQVLIGNIGSAEHLDYSVPDYELTI